VSWLSCAYPMDIVYFERICARMYWAVKVSVWMEGASRHIISVLASPAVVVFSGPLLQCSLCCHMNPAFSMQLLFPFSPSIVRVTAGVQRVTKQTFMEIC
jgi:hypothetical protein